MDFKILPIVVDTNVVFSALIKNKLTRKLLLDQRLALFYPEHLETEFAKHNREISARVGISEKKSEQTFYLLMKKSGIRFLPQSSYDFLKPQALASCPSGHENDWPFLALAIFLNCALWSNDKALKKQSRVAVHSTREIAQMLGTNLSRSF